MSRVEKSVFENKTMSDICEELINHCRAGGSFETFGPRKRISLALLQEWCSRDIDFQNAVKQSKYEELFFWEKALKDELEKPKRDPSLMRLCEANLNRLREHLTRQLSGDLLRPEVKRSTAIARSDADMLEEIQKEMEREMGALF